MRARPMPVVMVSSLTEKGCQTAMRALELGAVDFVTKPKIDVKTGTVELGPEIIEKVKIAARAKVRTRQRTPSPPPSAPVVKSGGLFQTTHKVVCIGASTGGTEALADVLTALPADAPGIAIVQHMPAGFTRSFAARLDGTCQIRVKEAQDGDRILQGHALLAPGGLHMAVTRIGANYTVRVPPASRSTGTVLPSMSCSSRPPGTSGATRWASFSRGWAMTGQRDLWRCDKQGRERLRRTRPPVSCSACPRRRLPWAAPNKCALGKHRGPLSRSGTRQLPGGSRWLVRIIHDL